MCHLLDPNAAAWLDLRVYTRLAVLKPIDSTCSGEEATRNPHHWHHLRISRNVNSIESETLGEFQQSVF